MPTVVGTDPGMTEVNFGYDESGKFYDFATAIGNLIDLCIKEGAVLNATFDGDGEESDDFWQYVVKDNVFEHLQGQVTFPDEEDAKAKAAWEIRNVMKDYVKTTGSHGTVIPRPDRTRDLTCVGLPKCQDCVAERDMLWQFFWAL